LASFFNVQDPAQVVFTKSCTEALNVALKGLLKLGDHVITTSMEHNSVLRPLSRLHRSGVEVTVLQANKEGCVTPEQVAEAIRDNTKLVAVTHASNVVGTIMPIADIGKVAHDHGVLFLVDAAQTAGVLPIDMEQCFIDVLCVPGHKSLMGPTGTGALLVREGVVVEPLIEGGTGSLSESVEQPSFMPDRLESGTLNVVGIAGLKAGLEFIMEVGLSDIRQHELKLTQMFLEGLSELDNITVYGPKDTERMVGVVSAVVKGVDPARVSALLDQEYGIATRPGLHCAPLAHKSIGTFETGTVRFSVGFFNTVEDIEETVRAMKHIVK
jgi:cysteine desulfurase family protein